MYRTAPQIVFQFVGGFSITQYTYPILFTSFKNPQNGSTTRSGATSSSTASSNVPAVDSISGMWGKMKWSVNLGGSGKATSLSEDVETLLRSYRTLSSIALSLIVASGGAPALIGAGISIYCDGTPEGMARYAKLKQRWHDFNKA